MGSSLAVLVLLVDPRTKKSRLQKSSTPAQRCVHERPDYTNGEYVRASGIENEAKQRLGEPQFSRANQKKRVNGVSSALPLFPANGSGNVEYLRPSTECVDCAEVGQTSASPDPYLSQNGSGFLGPFCPSWFVARTEMNLDEDLRLYHAFPIFISLSIEMNAVEGKKQEYSLH
ncbi:hypothetical protein EDD85DRAFT_975183 [Armillaria nabsnona]|nr:hypothetical protein EDD85DRAFT_975183 [Armillaria nabsnona]